MVRDTMRDPNPPHESYIPTSGGLFRDMVIHDFDCVRWVMGCEPVEVFAMGANLVDPVFAKYGDIDTCTVNIRFESGALGAIDASRRSGFGYDVRTEIFGSNGAIMIGEGRETPLYRYNSDGVWSDHIHWFLERFDAAYVAEIRAFVECVRHDMPVPITGSDGRAALAMAYAAEASIKENAPVSMSRFAVQTSTTMNARELILHSAVDSADGVLIHVDTESAGWEFIGLTVHRIDLGAPLSVESDGSEYALVLLSGSCDIVHGTERISLGPRANVFDDPPWAYYLPVGSNCSVEVESTAEIAICRSKATVAHPPRLIAPEDVAIEIRGAGNASREIRHIIKPEFPADSAAGGRSDYPKWKLVQLSAAQARHPRYAARGRSRGNLLLPN